MSFRLPTAMVVCALTAGAAIAQTNPLDFLTITPITDNNPLTNELGRDRVSINSTPFKNESIVSVGSYQFTTYFREDGRLLIARRDRRTPAAGWHIRATEFTSYNINDSHNVPVLAVDGDGYMHLSWGMHNHNLLYTRSSAPVVNGLPMSFIGDTIGNSGAINTMVGQHETSVTYPNFINIPGTGDLLFNYRTGGSGNGIYRISRWDNATDTWSFTDVDWIARTDSRGLTYNAYPHNFSYDEAGGLHASWTFRYNNSSPTGNSGFQTNHNIFYGFSPDNGATWFRDPEGTIPYAGVIDDVTSEVIVPIPEGSSLINTGTQDIDANGNLGIATWWAPLAQAAEPDHNRQYMFVGYDGSDWFTSQITYRLSDNLTSPIPESSLGVNHMGRPQILFDDYNRAYVVYKDADRGGGVTVAVSQAESRDDWQLIDLTTTDLGRYEPTPDRTLWDMQRQLHLLVQTVDNNSDNGGSPMTMVEWDAAAAMGRVLKWTGDQSATWDTSTINFDDLGSPDTFGNFDNVTFDDASSETSVVIDSPISAGRVVVDSTGSYLFSGNGSLATGSLAVVGGGTLELATSGNNYAGPTRVSNATLVISGDANDMVSDMIVAIGGTLLLDPTDAANMASRFEIWPSGTLEIGRVGSTANVFPDSPTSVFNDGLIRVNVDETLSNVSGKGVIEIAHGTTNLHSNDTFRGTLLVTPGATARVADSLGLGTSGTRAVVEAGGQLVIDHGGNAAQSLVLAGDGGGSGALQVTAGHSLSMSGRIELQSPATVIDIASGASAILTQSVVGTGGLVKQGGGILHLTGNNGYEGSTIVNQGTLIVDNITGLGDTTVSSQATLQTGGLVQGNLTAQSGAVVRVGEPGTPFSPVVYEEHFTGSGGVPLNGRAPSVASSGAQWVAHPSIASNGQNISIAGGSSATLPLDVEAGFVYTLEASFRDVVGDADWLALGFIEGVMTGVGANGDRFIGDPTTGKAWMLFRGDNSTNTNSTFLGTETSGTQNVVPWPTLNLNGGDIDVRIVLDTTGGDGNFTAEFFARSPQSTEYSLLRPATTLASEDIGAVGFAVSHSDVVGDVEFFRLIREGGFVPPPPGMNVAGDFVLQAGSLLEFDISTPTLHDKLIVDGTFDMAGDLVVLLDDEAPTPSAGDVFDLIDAASASGLFGRATLPTLTTGLVWDNSQLATSGQLSVAVGLGGDFNGDGLVDAADYTVWRDSLGDYGVSLAADANGDLHVDVSDLAIWRSQFGTSLAQLQLAGGAVPEPTAFTVFALALIGVGFAARQQRCYSK